MVVASRNRRVELLQTIPRHRAVTVLVDNHSSDGTAAAAHGAFPDLSVMRLARNGGAFARTIGARAASSEFVAFADDDSWWAPGSLHAAADILASHPAVAAVVARILVGPQERVDPISTVMARSPLPRLPGTPPWSGSSPAPLWSAGRPSWPSAGSTILFVFPGKRNGWPWTWSTMVTRSSMPMR